MAEVAKKPAEYQDLFDIPENMTGEIVAGELIVSPRPSRRHVYTGSALGVQIGQAFRFGRSSPGGWVILDEPEVAFGENILVPDMAGWRRERFPVEEPHNWISVAPDWVCEILSARSAPIDRARKMPIYAFHQVSHAWLIDPVIRTLEVFRLDVDKWVLLAVYTGGAKVCAEPFADVEFDLGTLWLD